MDGVRTDGALATALRRHRLARARTQEQLAEAAGVGVRTLRDLELGTAVHPRPGTVRRLADALELDPAEREALLATARSNRIIGAGRAAPAGATIGCSLPRDLPDLVGRDTELAAVAGGDGLVVVSGPPGVGKTSLAVRAAHRLAAGRGGACCAELTCPDGRAVPLAQALGQLMTVFTLDPARWPATTTDRLAALQRLASQHRGVMLLDNAVDEATVAALSPAAPGWLVVVTSRGPLPGLAGVTRRVTLGPLGTDAGVRLLAAVAGAERVDREPRAAAELVELCGGLPLALRVVANRLAARPTTTLHSLADRLRDPRTRLDRLHAGDLDVRAAIGSAYARLPEPARRAVRRWGPRPVLEHDGALLPEPVREALAGSGLIQQTGAHGTFRLHPLVALYCGELAAGHDPPPAARTG